MRRRKGCFAGDPYFAREFKTSTRTIRRWMLALKKRELITTTGRGKNRRIYTTKIELQSQLSPLRNGQKKTNGRTVSKEWPYGVQRMAVPIYTDLTDQLSTESKATGCDPPPNRKRFNEMTDKELQDYIAG